MLFRHNGDGGAALFNPKLGASTTIAYPALVAFEAATNNRNVGILAIGSRAQGNANPPYLNGLGLGALRANVAGGPVVRETVYSYGVGGTGALGYTNDCSGVSLAFVDRRIRFEDAGFEWVCDQVTEDAPSIKPETAAKTVGAAVPAAPRGLCRELGDLIAYTDDTTTKCTALFFRLLALLEAVSAHEDIVTGDGFRIADLYPQTEAEFDAAADVNYGMAGVLRRELFLAILNTTVPGIVLDVSGSSAPMTATTAHILQQVSLPHVGVTAGAGNRAHGLAHYVPGHYVVMAYGVMRGGRRPVYPALAAPAVPFTAQNILSAVNYVLQCTGDRAGLELAVELAAARVRFIGPEVVHLSTTLDVRWHNLPARVAALSELLWVHLVEATTGEWPPGYDAARLAGIANNAQAAGASAITDVMIEPERGVANVVADGAAGLACQASPALCRLARECGSARDFYRAMTTNEQRVVLERLHTWEHTAIFVQAALLLTLPVRNNALGAQAYNWDNTSSALSLPAYGIEAMATVNSSCGLSLLRKKVTHLRKPDPTKVIRLVDGATFQKWFYGVACAMRASSDAVMGALLISEMHNELYNGTDVGNLNAHSAQLYFDTIAQGGNLVDDVQRFVDTAILNYTGLSCMVDATVSTVSCALPSSIGRDNRTCLAALHPTFAAAVIDSPVGLGGAVDMDVTKLRGSLGADRVPWYGLVKDDLRDVDIAGVFNMMAHFRHLRLAYSKELLIFDPEQGTDYRTIMPLAEYGAVRISDATSHVGPLPTPAIWWCAVPVPGRLMVTGAVVTAGAQGYASGMDSRVNGTTINASVRPLRLVPPALQLVYLKSEYVYRKDLASWAAITPVQIDPQYDPYSPKGLWHDVVSYEHTARSVRFYHNASRAFVGVVNRAHTSVPAKTWEIIHKYSPFSVPLAITPGATADASAGGGVAGTIAAAASDAVAGQPAKN